MPKQERRHSQAEFLVALQKILTPKPPNCINIRSTVYTDECSRYNSGMDASPIFAALNAAQREAVATEDGARLVLAGAGSGKTRVLTHRIAYLVQVQQVSPMSLLAVTFTNKAAREMRARIGELLARPLGGLWIGTFHGICHRLLRLHYREAGLPEGFEIIDNDDQYRLIRRVLRELELDETYYPPRTMQWAVNHYKEEARRAEQLPASDDAQQRTMYKIYMHYEQLCQRSGLVDFAELLLRTWELFQRSANVREHYQQRFLHVLVDEFQDTNAIQYQWLKSLVAKHNNLFAVGDDDQSIYGWRGARVENVLNFQKDFTGAQVFRLEQNYRSSGTILKAANAIIEHNSGRLGKELWTEAAAGPPIRLYAAHNEIDEAHFVTQQIRTWVDGKPARRREQCAILYRSNAQSRAFEEQLMQARMPYRVYGGLRFFERAEVKDALAYLRLLANRDSDPAFLRVVNVPTRGIGLKTVEAIRMHARTEQISMWQAMEAVIGEQQLPARALTALHQFQTLITDGVRATTDAALAEVTEYVLEHSGLLAHYAKEPGEIAEIRVENLRELVNAARNFKSNEDTEPAKLADFLAHSSLEADDLSPVAMDDCVQLMSLHSAKGLEFPLVFLCGLEEGLFPHQRAVDEDGRLEEERRLCYVGITRAMQQLYLCYAEIRRLYGRENYTARSRFLQEIPTQFVEEIRPVHSRPPNRSSYSPNHSPRATPTASGNGFHPGQAVRHKKFGDGVVVTLEGSGEYARVQVQFAEVGMKWLVCSYAYLEKI